MKKEYDNERTRLGTTYSDENKEPQLFRVLLHNDEKTPMEFVIEILEKFFFMGRSRAIQHLMEAYRTGKTCCGIYTRDTAATKVSQVVDYVRVKDFSLLCSLEAA